MTPQPAVLEMQDVSKRYAALRPLRIAALTIARGERVSIGGIDAGAGELLVNLVTGASLPDDGRIRVFGRLTSEITDSDDWLLSLERFGIVSPRGVLLEGSTLEQNLAMPFTLEIEPVPAGVAEQVRRLALRCGIEPQRWLPARAGDLPSDVRVRAHLARALALDPLFVLVEHPTADVDQKAAAALGADLVTACSGGEVTTLVLTNDDAFARVVAARNLRLDAASGALKPLSRGWFGR